MKHFASLCLVFLMIVGTAAAQGQPAAQHAGNTATWNIVFDQNRWINLNRLTVKMPEQKDLFVTVTFECGLLEGGPETAFTDAIVRVVAVIDGKDAGPGRFEACGKTNELARFNNTVPCSANSWRHWRNCGVAGVQEQQLQRSLRSKTATFILEDVGVGVHEVVIKTFLWNGEPGKVVRGVVGDVSLQAEIVRLVRNGK